MSEIQKNIDPKLIEALVLKYNDVLLSRVESRYIVNSTLLLVSITMFAIVVSLNSPIEGIGCSRILLRLTVLLNSLCVLCSSLTLYSRIVLGNLNVRTSAKVLDDPGLLLKKGDTYILPEEAKMPRMFLIFQKVSYFAFLGMIICYTLFAMRE